VKVAAVQIESSSGHEMETIARYIKRAAADNAQIIVFPEYILGIFY
jgi:predicted amidohydrolase